jgi:predicted PurR-regulated permease PerM
MVFPDRRTAGVLLTILLFALALAIVYVARTVIVIFALSILFAYLINPVVRFLQRHSLFFRNLRGPHVLEAYLAIIVVVLLLFHGLVPEFRKNVGRILLAIPALENNISSGEIANNLGSNRSWADERANQIRVLLERHHSNIDRALREIEQAAPTAFAGILLIPILALFFLRDGETLAHQVIHLVATKENQGALESLAGELHRMLQRYIRAKVILGGLSLLYCSIAMLLLGFPNAIALGILAGILEFIPVIGWMTAAATIVAAGVLTHSHWIWMLALIAVWRILMDYGIAPRVMGHELEIHPLLAIFTLMVGGAVGGIVGIYLSVPLVAASRVIYRRLAASHPADASPPVVLSTSRSRRARSPRPPEAGEGSKSCITRCVQYADASATQFRFRRRF